MTKSTLLVVRKSLIDSVSDDLKMGSLVFSAQLANGFGACLKFLPTGLSGFDKNPASKLRCKSFSAIGIAIALDEAK